MKYVVTLLLSLLLCFAGYSQVSNDVSADRVIANKSLYLKNTWVTGIKSNSDTGTRDDSNIPTTLWVEKYLGSFAIGVRSPYLRWDDVTKQLYFDSTYGVRSGFLVKRGDTLRYFVGTDSVTVGVFAGGGSSGFADTTNNTYLTYRLGDLRYIKKSDTSATTGYARIWQITDVISRLPDSTTNTYITRTQGDSRYLKLEDSTSISGYSRNWQITDALSKINRLDTSGYMHIKYSIPETVTGIKTFSDSAFLSSGTVVNTDPTNTLNSRNLTFRSVASTGALMQSIISQEGLNTPGTEALKLYTGGYLSFQSYGNNGSNKGLYEFGYDAKLRGQTSLKLYTTSTTAGVSIGNDYNQTSGMLFNVYNNASTQYLSILSNGSIGINNSAPSSSALLDLTSTTKGLLIPRMTSSERDVISTPATGLLVWNTTNKTLDAYQGNSWGSIAGDYSRTLRILRCLGSPFVAEPFWGLFGTNGSSNLINATGYYCAFLLEKETTLTGVYWLQGTSGVYTNDLYSGFSIYSVSGTTLTKLIESTNDASLFKGTVGAWGNKTFSSTITLAPGVYYLGLLWRGTSITTTPAIYGTSSTVALGNLAGSSLKVTYQINGQNGFPATINVASANTSIYYYSIFPY